MIKLTSRFLVVFFLTSLFYPLSAFASEVATYDQLLHAIRETRNSSQQRIEAAVEQEKVREAWETGKLIDEHVLQHKERADYGDQVIIKLAKDLESSETELRYMLQFARTYSQIPRTSDELSWGHYESLLALNEKKDREEVENLASKERWPLKRLREEVRNRKIAKGEREPKPETGLAPINPGKLYTYKVIRAKAGALKGQLVLDLGFANYYRPDKLDKFKEGDLLILEKGKLKKLNNPSPEFLYTYNVDVYQVLDGDTVNAVVDLGFNILTQQTLRLRGLDAPEIITKEGKEAKTFLEKQLKKLPILIHSVKSDKYDRYLIDLFADGEYLNQKLLSEGFAAVMEE